MFRLARQRHEEYLTRKNDFDHGWKVRINAVMAMNLITTILTHRLMHIMRNLDMWQEEYKAATCRKSFLDSRRQYNNAKRTTLSIEQRKQHALLAFLKKIIASHNKFLSTVGINKLIRGICIGTCWPGTQARNGSSAAATNGVIIRRRECATVPL